MNTGPDYQLGQKIGSLITSQAASNLPSSAILSHVQDLLGADTALLAPIRDLLLRPAYRQLFSGAQQSVQLGGRDAVLQDLANTYHPRVLARLAAVIDGSLGLPPGPLPAASAGERFQPMGSAGGRAGGPGDWSDADSQIPFTQPAPSTRTANAPPAVQQAPVASPPAAASGPTPVTALLIALVSLLSGAVLLGLGWLLVANRPPTPSVTVQPPSTPAQPSPSTPPSPHATPKDTTPTPPTSAPGAWGSASEYKFGQLPGGAYPNSCAFSVTDGSGRIITDKANIEYWACRVVGGNPESGYRVVWADGKETNYTFAAKGDGMVVGTNGSTYPMRWRNDSHQGTPIVVINHQDGATTWIPGHID